jgi:hypothetical protein
MRLSALVFASVLSAALSAHASEEVEKVNVKSTAAAYEALKALPPLVQELSAVAYASGSAVRLVSFKGTITSSTPPTGSVHGGPGVSHKRCRLNGTLVIDIGGDKREIEIKESLERNLVGNCPTLKTPGESTLPVQD